jgi:peptide/nickel transport system ATP-binding protein
MSAGGDSASSAGARALAPQAPALQIEDLRVSFRRRDRDLPVLRGVTLEIGAGEAYGLVGESGCGKTTLALAMMRYLASNGSVDGGSIRVDGQDVLALSEHALRRWRGQRLAMVYQDPASALNPAMRVGSQIAEVFQFHEGLSRGEARERARESLAKVAMPDPESTLRRYPFELSGGQQQRVVIAMALAGDPKLLVLDEPTTGLDATVEAEILDLIEELRGRINAAILLISHNLGLVARLCERVGVLYAGRVVEQGPARQLFTDPRHPYTMGLLSCVPRFGMRKDLVSLRPIPGTLPALGTLMPGCVYATRCALKQPVCTQREPDLYGWPGEFAEQGCRHAESSSPDPVSPSPNDAAAVGYAERHTRCYYPHRVPSLAERKEEQERTERATAFDTRTSETLLDAQNLRRTFRDGRKTLTAVHDVSLTVRRGETLGLVGESGSGKTTFARCVSGLIPADSGDLLFAGQPLQKRSSKRDREVLRAIQMVFQNPDSTLNPAWSTRGILGRAVKRLAGLRGSQQIARVDELARSVRVEAQFLDAKPAELSGGQKQRIAIARAFAGHPALVLCDEPASALDVSVQANILNLLAELQATQGVSYVFISHDLAVVRYLSDRIGVMYLAELMELGSSEDVFNPPHHPYTEALLSAIPTLDFERPRQRIALRGPIPSLSAPPTGCRFHTRCHRFLGDICVEVEPPWRDVGSGHFYRCHILEAELRDLQLAKTAAGPSAAGDASAATEA